MKNFENISRVVNSAHLPSHTKAEVLSVLNAAAAQGLENEAGRTAELISKLSHALLNEGALRQAGIRVESAE
jgi:hypothetical protein